MAHTKKTNSQLLFNGLLAENPIFRLALSMCPAVGISTSVMNGILLGVAVLFPNVRAFLLMGDVAIKAINNIARRAGEKRVIPAGSTYKIRDHEYFFRGKRAFPSYLQAGPSFFIEKSKRKTIAQDIAATLNLANG